MPTFGAPSPKAIIQKVNDDDVSTTVVDLSANALYLMKIPDYTALLSEALAGNTRLVSLTLMKLSLADAELESLAPGIGASRVLATVNLQTNRIGNEGASALARALRSNASVTHLNLLNQTPGAFTDATVPDWLRLLDANVTLQKVSWRVESRDGFALKRAIRAF